MKSELSQNNTLSLGRGVAAVFYSLSSWRGKYMTDCSNTILIFTSREICYNSHYFFAHQMEAAFEKLGYKVVMCEFTREDDFDAVLAPHIGKTYKLILDFNSLLPQLEEEDGTPVLNLIHGPFYDYILDHPLFHYNCLSAKADDFHAILLDEAQEAYVKNFYKGVKGTLMMPLGATEAVSELKRKTTPDNVLFMGSYDSEEKLLQMIRNMQEPLRTIAFHILEKRLENPLLTQEQAFEEVLMEHGMGLDDLQFALFMNRMYAVDAYVRNHFRRKTIDTLVKYRIPVKIVGEGWEKYRSFDESFVTREREVEFGLSFEKIAKEHILLNNSPFFNRGAHDRIYAGMANHCAVLTDTNPYLERTLTDRENVMLYSLKDEKGIKDRAEELLTNHGLCKSIQENAYLEFKQKHTWECRVQKLLEQLKNK